MKLSYLIGEFISGEYRPVFVVDNENAAKQVVSVSKKERSGKIFRAYRPIITLEFSDIIPDSCDDDGNRGIIVYFNE